MPLRRDHYSADGAAAATTIFKLQKPTTSRSQEAKAAAILAKADAKIMREVATRVKGKRQAPPKARGMDQPGAFSQVHWAPARADAVAGPARAAQLALGEALVPETRANRETQTLLAHAGHLIAVVIDDELRLAQLKDALLRVSKHVGKAPPTKRLEPSRPKVRLYIDEEEDDATGDTPFKTSRPAWYEVDGGDVIAKVQMTGCFDVQHDKSARIKEFVMRKGEWDRLEALWNDDCFILDDGTPSSDEDDEDDVVVDPTKRVRKRLREPGFAYN